MSTFTDELLTRRQRLVAHCRALKTELTKAKRGIGALDAVLRMESPDYKPDAPAANHRPGGSQVYFGHGQLVAAALEALRTMEGPASATDCARLILTDRGMPDTELSRLSTKVASTFGQKAATGQVERINNGDGRSVLWRIAR